MCWPNIILLLKHGDSVAVATSAPAAFPATTMAKILSAGICIVVGTGEVLEKPAGHNNNDNNNNNNNNNDDDDSSSSSSSSRATTVQSGHSVGSSSQSSRTMNNVHTLMLLKTRGTARRPFQAVGIEAIGEIYAMFDKNLRE